MSKPAFRCLDCESYIVSISRNADGLHCPGCGGLIVSIPYEEFKYGIGIKREESKPLITIELEDIDSVPMVFYKGEELKSLIHVGIDWSTDTDKPALTHIRLEYVDQSSDKRPNVKVIEYNPSNNRGLVDCNAKTT